MIEKLYYSLAGQRNGAGAGMIPSFLMLAIAVMAFALGSCGGTGPLPPADTTAPTVLSISPINGELNVSIDSSIQITFSESMDASSINAQAIKLKTENGDAVIGQVTPSGKIAVFKPMVNLNPLTWYSIYIDKTVKDAAGNAMSAPVGSLFKTGAGPDIVRPQVFATAPENGATGHPTNASIMITFTEQMDPNTINNMTITLVSSAGSASIPVSGSVTYSGKIAIFYPVNNLLGNTLYTASVSTGATDLAGNLLQGNQLNGNYLWSFSTGTAPDTTAPVVTAVTPTKDAIDVDVSTAITVTFSEPVDESTIQFVLSANSTTVPYVMSYLGSTATFTTSGLSYNTFYSAKVSGARDMANNLMSDYTWSFTTTKAATSTSLLSSANPSPFNSLVTFTAIVTSAGGTPTGDVTFKDGTFVIGAPIALSGGVASFSTSDLAVGSHSITAVYSGVGIFSASTSSSFVQTVNKADQATLGIIAPTSLTYGNSATLSITGGSGTGAVTYVVGSSTGCSVSGSSLSVTNATGTCSVTATKAGDAYYIEATSAASSVVLFKANSTVTAWPTASDITYGQTLASSILTGGSTTPGGTFTFTTPSTAPGAGTSAQSVTFTPADAANYNTITGSVSVTVSKANPTVTAWPTASAITYGQTLVDSTLTGGTATPNGTFTFTSPSTAPGAGTAAQSVTFTPTDTINYNTITGTVNVTVNKATPMITWSKPLDIMYGTALNSTQLNATVTPDIAGTFTYTPSSDTILSSGDHTLSVIFTPTDTTNYNTSAATVQITVTKIAQATLNIVAPSSLTYGATATLSTTGGSGNGTVTYSAGGSTGCSVIGDTLSVINASGICSVTATKGEDANYASVTSAPAIVAMNKADQTALSLVAPASLTYGDTATLSANGGSSTGAVTYSVGTSNGCSVSGDILSVKEAIGTCSVTAMKAGDDNYNAVTSAAISVILNKAIASVFLSNLNQTYDGNPRLVTATTTPGELVVEVTYNGSLLAPTNVGEYIVVGTIVSPNYQGNASGTLVINKATPVINWSNPADITYGTALSGAQLNATALIGGSFIYTPAMSTVLNAGSAQTLSVEFTPNDTVNYISTTVSVLINVNKADQTILFEPLANKTTSDPPFDLTASASSGLPVTYSSSHKNVATIAGSTVTINGFGTTTITASQGGDSNYNAAVSVSQLLTVN